MANEIVQINTNPIDWSSFDTTTVIDDGYVLWFENHPDSPGSIAQLIGDGTSQASALTPLTVAGAKYLTPGRKFADELTTTIPANADGTYTVAEFSTQPVVQSASIYFSMWYGSAFITGRVKAYDTNVVNDETQKVEILDISSPSGYSLDSVIVLVSSTLGSGGKLQVVIDADSANRNLIVCMWGGSSSGTKKWSLVSATTTNNTLCPDGVTTGTAIEAGAELYAIAGGGSFPDPRMLASCESTTSLRLTILFPETVKQNASTITFPAAFNIKSSTGSILYSVSAGQSFSVYNINNDLVSLIITTTGLPSGSMGYVVGTNVTAELA